MVAKVFVQCLLSRVKVRFDVAGEDGGKQKCVAMVTGDVIGRLAKANIERGRC